MSTGALEVINSLKNDHPRVFDEYKRMIIFVSTNSIDNNSTSDISWCYEIISRSEAEAANLKDLVEYVTVDETTSTIIFSASSFNKDYLTAMNDLRVFNKRRYRVPKSETAILDVLSTFIKKCRAPERHDYVDRLVSQALSNNERAQLFCNNSSYKIVNIAGDSSYAIPYTVLNKVRKKAFEIFKNKALNDSENFEEFLRMTGFKNPELTMALSKGTNLKKFLPDPGNSNSRSHPSNVPSNSSTIGIFNLHSHKLDINTLNSDILRQCNILAKNNARSGCRSYRPAGSRPGNLLVKTLTAIHLFIRNNNLSNSDDDLTHATIEILSHCLDAFHDLDTISDDLYRNIESNYVTVLKALGINNIPVIGLVHCGVRLRIYRKQISEHVTVPTLNALSTDIITALSNYNTEQLDSFHSTLYNYLDTSISPEHLVERIDNPELTSTLSEYIRMIWLINVHNTTYPPFLSNLDDFINRVIAAFACTWENSNKNDDSLAIRLSEYMFTILRHHGSIANARVINYIVQTTIHNHVSPLVQNNRMTYEEFNSCSRINTRNEVTTKTPFDYLENDIIDVRLKNIEREHKVLEEKKKLMNSVKEEIDQFGGVNKLKADYDKEISVITEKYLDKMLAAR